MPEQRKEEPRCEWHSGGEGVGASTYSVDITRPLASSTQRVSGRAVLCPVYAFLLPKVRATPMASVLPARARLLDLARLRCSIFNTTFNPTSTRTGAKYLRARLRGPSMVQYYPERLSMRHLNAMFPEAPSIPDLKEMQRVEDVETKKARGKGAPKKAKSKGMSLHFDIPHTLLTVTFRGQPESGKEKAQIDMYLHPDSIAFGSILCRLPETSASRCAHCLFLFPSASVPSSEAGINPDPLPNVPLHSIHDASPHPRLHNNHYLHRPSADSCPPHLQPEPESPPASRSRQASRFRPHLHASRASRSRQETFSYRTYETSTFICT
jgi:small subunit ribosomal protein S33